MENLFINNYINLLKQYVKTNQFMGWDPYDILNCKFISDQNFGPKLNLLLTQINRILPINFRNIIGISKIYNSKAMALFLSSLLNLEENLFSKEKNLLVNWLVSNKSKKYKEYSIGFSYDIVLQGGSSKRGDPSLIITLFVMYAFIGYYKETYSKDIVNYIFSFKELINRRLPKVENKNTVWYSYNFDKFSEVYNATAKVGRYFALLYSISKEEILLERIDKILNYLSLKQRADGSWPYAEKAPYTDGFHTAFVLEAIYDMLKYVSSKKYEQMYENGLSHYMAHLFERNGQPLYFHKSYPPRDIRKVLIETDIRDCAMAIILFSKIGQIDQAKRVLSWSLENMYNENKGYFYYYKNKLWTNKIEYIRWQAWMLYAFSVLKNKEK